MGTTFVCLLHVRELFLINYRLIIYRIIVMLKPIKTEEEYNTALAHAYELMQTDLIEGSAASDEMEVLSLLIKAYELVHYPIT